MIKNTIKENVTYNCDDPDKMIVTKDDFVKTVSIFNIPVFKWSKYMTQGFENNKHKKLGF